MFNHIFNLKFWCWNVKFNERLFPMTALILINNVSCVSFSEVIQPKILINAFLTTTEKNKTLRESCTKKHIKGHIKPLWTLKFLKSWHKSNFRVIRGWVGK